MGSWELRVISQITAPGRRWPDSRLPAFPRPPASLSAHRFYEKLKWLNSSCSSPLKCLKIVLLSKECFFPQTIVLKKKPPLISPRLWMGSVVMHTHHFTHVERKSSCQCWLFWEIKIIEKEDFAFRQQEFQKWFSIVSPYRWRPLPRGSWWVSPQSSAHVPPPKLLCPCWVLINPRSGWCNAGKGTSVVWRLCRLSWTE